MEPFINNAFFFVSSGDRRILINVEMEMETDKKMAQKERTEEREIIRNVSVDIYITAPTLWTWTVFYPLPHTRWV